MKQGLTEIICVIDKSGSMDSIKSDAIGAFNSFLKAQKELPGEAKLTLTLFDTDYQIRLNGVDIQSVPDLTPQTFMCGGCTALLDAAGRTIDKVGERLDKTPESERPEKVIMVILTDGQENSSKEYTHEKLMAKINHQRDVYHWEFIFLAANQDAIQAGQSIGIHNNVNYAATGKGVMRAAACFCSAVSSYRTTGHVGTIDPHQANA